MKGTNTWSYHPYRPFFFEVGDIYICRVAPTEHSIHFEWLNIGEAVYEIFCRLRGAEEFSLYGKTTNCAFDITGLEAECEYEFYVACGDQKSRVRLARCGKSVGTVVNYLHPDDEAYAFSGRYLCSPSMVRHPDGYLLASMDLFRGKDPQNLTLIFRSDDDGATWHYVSELTPCFWGMMFIHRGELYMLANSTEYGDLLIGKSTDGGKTFGAPTVLLRSSGGKSRDSGDIKAGAHKNPQNIVYHNGRIYETLEWGAWESSYGIAPMVMSCDENADLLVAENWHFSEPKKLRDFAPQFEASGIDPDTITIEGTLAVAPDGRLLNHMRIEHYQKSLVFEVNTDDPDAPLAYSHCIDFPANKAKFMIRYDQPSGYYYTIGDQLYDPQKDNARNLLSLLRSADLIHWEVVCDLFDYRHEDCKQVGFQYVNFLIEGDDIIYLCRTAINGAKSFHDNNYSTFHTIKKFRELSR